MPLNLTQEFTFETDDVNTLERMLTAVCPILFELGPQGIPIHYGRYAQVPEDYPSHSAAWYLRFKGPIYPLPYPLHLFICALGDAYGAYKETAWCASYNQLVAAAMSAVKSVSHEQFISVAGRSGPFDGADGNTVVGYRTHLATCKGPSLSISLCHIYYSK